MILTGHGLMETAEAPDHEPRAVFVAADNTIIGTGSDPAGVLSGTGLRRGDLTESVS